LIADSMSINPPQAIYLNPAVYTSDTSIGT
jgi:hypothetical protein